MAASAHKDETFQVGSTEDVVRVRQAARARAVELGFNLVEQTKLVTAVSELTRNTVEFGGGGTVRLEVVNRGHRQGLRVTFEDQGPGIKDLGLALTDGYTSGSGLGLGLGGSKRLVHDFEIVSRVGEGTCVTIAMWNNR
jgi:serine/threonine-protein kinase RsbT